jgi:DNA-binding NarL/FixJ family response regulator
MTKKYSILIVEDEPLIAEDIAGSLDEYGFEVAGIACDASTAIEMVSAYRPDAVLLDINLGSGPDGVEVAHFIRAQHDVPFVFLTSHSDKQTLERAKHTFPAGYLLKPFDGNELMASLEIALFNHFNQRSQMTTLDFEVVNANLPTPLSQRELELLALLRTGSTNKEIADRMFISVNTVKTHLQHLFGKLDVSNRTQALFRLRELTGS